MKLKRFLLGALLVFIVGSFWLSGYTVGQKHKLLLERQPAHQHQWGDWGQPNKLDGDTRLSKSYIQFHTCTNCGLSEYRFIQEQKR